MSMFLISLVQMIKFLMFTHLLHFLPNNVHMIYFYIGLAKKKKKINIERISLLCTHTFLNNNKNKTKQM